MIAKQRLKESKELPKFLSVITDQVLMSLTTLLTTVVLARTYSKNEYADIVLLFTISLFILGFQSAIISKPYAININDLESGEKRNYYLFNLNFKYFFTLFIAILFPLLYYVSFEQGNINNFIIFLLYVIAYSSYFFVRETFLSERKTVENLKYGLFCSLSLITVLLFVFFRYIENINTFLILASVIYLTASLHYFIKKTVLLNIFSKKYFPLWKMNIDVGKWLFGSNLLFHLSSNIYPWLILYLTEKDNVAVFGVLMSIASLVNPLLTAMSSYLLPVFVSKNKEYDKVHDSVKKWSIIFLLMGLILVIVGFFGGQQIISLLFGEKYSNLGVLIVFPFVVQSINITFQPLKIALNAIKRTDINFWILIPRSILAITVGYFLIKEYALLGVFYTMIIDNLFYQIMYLIQYRRVFNLNFSNE